MMTSKHSSSDKRMIPNKKNSSCTNITTMAGKSGSEIFNILADLSVFIL